MQMIYRVTVEFPVITTGMVVRRPFFFSDRHEADKFVQCTEKRNDGVTIVGTSIDHIMAAYEAIDEVDEEMEMAMRVAWQDQA